MSIITASNFLVVSFLYKMQQKRGEKKNVGTLVSSVKCTHLI